MFLKKYWLSITVIISAILIYGAYAIFTHFYMYETDAYLQSHVVIVSPEVSGKVKKLSVHDMEPVKKGQVIFKIDPTPYRALLAKAQGKLRTAQDTYQSLLAKRKAALSIIKKTEANLRYNQSQLKRFSELNKKDFISTQRTQDQKDLFTQAQSELVAAKAGLDSINALLGDGNE